MRLVSPDSYQPMPLLGTLLHKIVTVSLAKGSHEIVQA